MSAHVYLLWFVDTDRSLTAVRAIPQVIVIGRNSSEPTTNGESAHYGDKIQIFVRQADASAPAGGGAKLKCAPPVTDGATALTNGHRAPEESRL